MYAVSEAGSCSAPNPQEDKVAAILAKARSIRLQDLPEPNASSRNQPSASLNSSIRGKLQQKQDPSGKASLQSAAKSGADSAGAIRNLSADVRPRTGIRHDRAAISKTLSRSGTFRSRPDRAGPVIEKIQGNAQARDHKSRASPAAAAGPTSLSAADAKAVSDAAASGPATSSAAANTSATKAQGRDVQPSAVLPESQAGSTDAVAKPANQAHGRQLMPSATVNESQAEIAAAATAAAAHKHGTKLPPLQLPSSFRHALAGAR